MKPLTTAERVTRVERALSSAYGLDLEEFNNGIEPAAASSTEVPSASPPPLSDHERIERIERALGAGLGVTLD